MNFNLGTPLNASNAINDNELLFNRILSNLSWNPNELASIAVNLLKDRSISINALAFTNNIFMWRNSLCEALNLCRRVNSKLVGSNQFKMVYVECDTSSARTLLKLSNVFHTMSGLQPIFKRSTWHESTLGLKNSSHFVGMVPLKFLQYFWKNLAFWWNVWHNTSFAAQNDWIANKMVKMMNSFIIKKLKPMPWTRFFQLALTIGRHTSSLNSVFRSLGAKLINEITKTTHITQYMLRSIQKAWNNTLLSSLFGWPPLQFRGKRICRCRSHFLLKSKKNIVRTSWLEF